MLLTAFGLPAAHLTNRTAAAGRALQQASALAADAGTPAARRAHRVHAARIKAAERP